MSINNISVKDQEEVYITFVATAESGRTQEYTIQLLRKSSNADAQHIYVDGQEITDRFEDKDSVPTCIVSIGKTKETSTIKVVPENEFASIKNRRHRNGSRRKNSQKSKTRFIKWNNNNK